MQISCVSVEEATVYVNNNREPINGYANVSQPAHVSTFTSSQASVLWDLFNGPLLTSKNQSVADACVCAYAVRVRVCVVATFMEILA